jgi:hypothetical protein
MIIFGAFGYFTQRHKYPAAPLLLGLVLGDMLEQGFRRSMSVSNSDPTIFFTRPISLVIMIAALVSLVYSFIKFYWRRPATEKKEEVTHDSTVFDRIVVFLTIPIAVFLIIVAYEAPRPNMPQAVGPQVWPIGILGLMIICAVFLFLRTIREKREAPLAPGVSSPETVAVWYKKPGLSGALTIAGLLVYAAFLQSVGFIICTTLLVIYQARVIQKGKWPRNIVSAVIFSCAIYFALSKLLMVRLPPGLLDW